jgi:hypothetical protein
MSEAQLLLKNAENPSSKMQIASLEKRFFALPLQNRQRVYPTDIRQVFEWFGHFVSKLPQQMLFRIFGRFMIKIVKRE